MRPIHCVRVWHLLFALVASAVLLLSGCVRTTDAELAPREDVESVSQEDAAQPGFRIAYAEDTIPVENPDAVWTLSGPDTIGLEYRNDAYSTDGKNFDCYIANALRNEYDLFIAVYADAEMTDELYLSGLLPPGRAFSHIELNRALKDGTHLVYVAFSQVTEADGAQAMRAQALVTMDFHVNHFPEDLTTVPAQAGAVP